MRNASSLCCDDAGFITFVDGVVGTPDHSNTVSPVPNQCYLRMRIHQFAAPGHAPDHVEGTGTPRVNLNVYKAMQLQHCFLCDQFRYVTGRVFTNGKGEQLHNSQTCFM